MNTSAKKLLASVVAIVVIASPFVGLMLTGTIAGQPMCLLDEDFSGVWLPIGWAQQQPTEWEKSDSSYAGGTLPEAVLAYDDILGKFAYLDSKPVDTTGALSLMLEFKSFVDYWEGGGCNVTCKVYTRADASDSWTDVTPWGNPICSNVSANTYSIDIFSDIGSATQVRFEFDGTPNDLDWWYVDDVKICAVSPPPPPVGGVAYPLNKLAILAPWLILAVAVIAGARYWHDVKLRDRNWLVSGLQAIGSSRSCRMIRDKFKRLADSNFKFVK